MRKVYDITTQLNINTSYNAGNKSLAKMLTKTIKKGKAEAYVARRSYIIVRSFCGVNSLRGRGLIMLVFSTVYYFSPFKPFETLLKRFEG